jgi:solute carrier family 13 (sodium-dependent dicarboxylate transporter), member 2/3/5
MAQPPDIAGPNGAAQGGAAALAQPGGPAGSAPPPGVVSRKLAGRILCVALPIAIWVAPLNLPPTVKHTLAIVAFMTIAWITEALAHALTGLMGCYLFWALRVTTFGTAFSGFATVPPWFLFGAGLFGMMATKSGMARRLAYMVMLRVGSSYSRLLLAVILISFLLTFLVPSGIARVVIMAAVALGLMELFGLGKGSNVGRGIFLTLTYMAGCFDKMILAGPTSILGAGLIEKALHIQIYWSLWFIAFLPCSLLTIFATWWLALRLFPPENTSLSGGSEYLREALRKMGPWTRMEKKALLLMMIAVALWMTDFLHHLSPALVAVGIGLIGVLPVVGVLDQEDLKKVNVLMVFFVAAAISMGNVLVQTNALPVLTTVMFAWMRPLVRNVYSVALVPYWTAFVYHIFLGDEISMIGTSVPVLMKFAATNGLRALPLGLVWTFASSGKIFVYQSAVIVTGYSYGYFDARDMFKMGAYLTLFESLVLLLLVPFYWPLIGIR